jgi:hypothetical protein
VPAGPSYGHDHQVLKAVDESIASVSAAATPAQLHVARGAFRPDGCRTAAGPTPGEEELLLKRPGIASGDVKAIKKSVSASGLLRHE